MLDLAVIPTRRKEQRKQREIMQGEDKTNREWAIIKN
jgi:hypothetical protein